MTKHQKNFQSVIFDMDGTLIDSEPLWYQSIYEELLKVGLDIKQQSLPVDITGLRINESLAAFYQYFPWEGTTTQAELREAITDRCIEKIIKTKPVLPGVVESLTLCRSLNYKVGLASASPMRMIKRVTELLGITDYFDTIQSAETLRYPKPHPEVYLLTAEALHMLPTACITIEDSINGMVSTKAARMKSIVIPHHKMMHDSRWSLAEHKLNSLLELSPAHLS